MTNGEKFKEVFGISQVDEGELYAFAWLPNHDAVEIPIDWWNAEYKAKGFLSKFNKTIKTITPQEPKKGHWIDADGDNAICGCCNRLNHLYGTYCKYCGAKMIEPQESEG